ncbi:ABC transporter substrate-binding protein [Streptomyces sp. 6N223]|uniref:ABC transporter substrate-binding protein n=1 Tax=Streptomyces sp. 6N223 TaxID=3457412 RepID=UPI003FD6BAD2
MRVRHIRRTVAAAAAALLACTAAACADEGGAGSATGEAVDDGTELTMWVRSGTYPYTERLVDAYNASHDNQIELTAIPESSYLQRIGSAAGSGSLPDILGSDVADSPNYTTQGILMDITDRVNELSFVDDLAPAHLNAATLDGRIYAVPHKVDSSVLYYNKDLFEQAGLDPEAAPKTYDDIYEDAKAVAALGGDIQGFYFAGACGGCIAYTTFPAAYAAGNDVVTEDGRSVDLDNETFEETFALYKRMYDEGITDSSARNDDGSTWSAGFVAGKVGILLHGSLLVNEFKEEVTFDWGAAPLGSPDGSATSTFVGGEVAGISQTSQHPDQAWDFLAWSLGEEAQVEIAAKNGDLPARTDLTDNPYTSEDPRTMLIADNLVNGHTPATLPYGRVFNDANGPWVAGFRGAIFGDDPDGSLATAQEAIQDEIDAAY